MGGEGIESQTSPEIAVPEYWTVLYHGTNLGREEWQGEKQKVLDNEELTIKAGPIGLSCISREEQVRQAEDSKRIQTTFNSTAEYNTTKLYSTIGPEQEDKPAEIRILMPNFHDRTRLKEAGMAHFGGLVDDKGAQNILELTNKVFWRLNNQHPVVPNGTELVKLDDQILPDGRRVLSYVPKLVVNIYKHDAAEKAGG